MGKPRPSVSPTVRTSNRRPTSPADHRDQHAAVRTSLSGNELIDAADDWTDYWNENAAPFVWTKTAEGIPAKVRPACTTLTRFTNPATDQ